jgi:hypothetical protein
LTESSPSPSHTESPPCSPPFRAHTLPSAPMPSNTVIISQASNMSHHETDSMLTHTMAELLRTLLTESFRLTKDGSLLFELHDGLQMINKEHICIETLQRQIPIIQRMIHACSSILATIQDDEKPLGSQQGTTAQCRRHLNSIIVDAEASITAISGFLARAGT